MKKAVFWAEGKFLLVGGVGSCRKKKTLEKMRHTVDGRKPANHFRCIRTSLSSGTNMGKLPDNLNLFVQAPHAFTLSFTKWKTTTVTDSGTAGQWSKVCLKIKRARF